MLGTYTFPWFVNDHSSLSPTAGNIIEDMASVMELEFSSAHDAAADVSMTIKVMGWAYTQAQKRAQW